MLQSFVPIGPPAQWEPDMPLHLRIPHTLILMFGLIVLALVLTWVLPAGSYQMQVTDAGRSVVVPGTYAVLEHVPLLPPWAVLTVVPRAMADAQAVIFFVLLIGGVLGLVRRTGAIEAAIGRVLERFRERLAWLIFAAMFVFGAFSSSFGMAAEYIAFVGILVTLCAALRLDAMTAVGIMVVGYGVGYGVALTNPFTVMIAQEIAEVQPGSGMWYRALVIVPAFAVGFHHVYRYARRVQTDPASGLLANAESAAAAAPADYPPLTRRRTGVLLAVALTIVALVVGIVWRGWYLTELSALFLGLGVAVIIIGRIDLDDAGDTFIAGAALLMGTALLVGFARSIALLLEDGMVLHTVVHGLATPLSYVPAELSAIGMLLIQSLLNFLIPSGSGQAFATMPIMAPIGDLVGVTRQVAVLAYQFGDGFTNMIVPTNPVLMGILGLAGIPYDRWFRFVAPLILKLLVVSAGALVIGVWIGLE
jgi:uncharacterized ion transporter superfamily protein YfcC